MQIENPYIQEIRSANLNGRRGTGDPDRYCVAYENEFSNKRRDDKAYYR